MPEALLILPDNRPNPSGLWRQLDQCLAGLDAIGADIAAAHLAMAMDRLRIQFNLGEDGSGTD